MNQRKKGLTRTMPATVLAVMLAVVMLLSACGNSGNNGGSAGNAPSASPSAEPGDAPSDSPSASPSDASASPAAEGPPTPISIMVTFYGAEPPGPDNVVIKEVEKRTNTKLDITWVSPSSYNEKANVTLASGDIPDLMFLGDPFAPNVRAMAAQGAFWDLGPYIKDYPNLAKYPQEPWDNTKFQDGKNYAIPRVRGLEAGMVSVRKDWLDKLGLDVPKTTDDLYNVMKAFTNDDPDGNGKKDTVGLVGQIDPGGLNLGSFSGILSTFQHAAGGWKVDDSGNLVNMTTDPSTKDALAWLAKAYSEGLIHSDFATLKNNQVREIVMANKAGVDFEAVSAAWVLTEGIRKTVPQGDMLPLVSLTNPQGEAYNGKGTGFSGVFVIPKSVPEDKMKKILAFYDYGASDEGYELGSYGFEGVHFTKEGDFYKQTEQAAKDIVSTSAFGQVFTKFNPYIYATAPNIPTDFYNRNKQIIDEIGKVSISDPSLGLYSETWSKYQNEFNKKITDLQVKIILGTEKLDSWDAFVADLAKDPNWVKSMQELNDAYHKRAGK